MITFTAILQKFDEHGDKTGWTYIEVPADIAEKLNPGNKKAFRVKGKLDSYAIQGAGLIPMGGGKYLLAVNAAMRKGIKKNKGAMVKVQLMVDKPYELSTELLDCLADEPAALTFFKSLPKAHQNYFSKWIESAKTETTRAKRIAMTVSATAKKWGYPEMIRSAKKEKDS
ncbi:MAG: YdeI/OmpD-associated family protein [Agriterribacter sp.]